MRLPDDPEFTEDPDEDPDNEISFEDDHPAPPLEIQDDDAAVTNGHAQAPDDVAEISSPPPATRHVRLADLRVEYRLWVNPRSITGLDDPKIKELADSIRARTVTVGEQVIVGITDPLKIVRIQNAKGGEDILVVDGQRRYLAASSVFDPPAGELVPVVDSEPDPVTWTQELSDYYFAEALHGVGTREGLSAYELSDAALRLRGSKDRETSKTYTLARIAAVINRSESWVSKILTARGNASDALLASWRRGDITEEQFRDLAVVKDKAQQKAKVAEVAAAKQTGERGESRAMAKSQKLIARQEAKDAAPVKPAKGPLKTETKGKKTTIVRGPQAELPIVADAKPAAAEPRKPRPLPMAVVDDVLTTAQKYPPTHDMVRGIILGIRSAAGLLDMGDLPRPWQSYLTMVAAAQSHGRKEAASKKGKGKKK